MKRRRTLLAVLIAAATLAWRPDTVSAGEAPARVSVQAFEGDKGDVLRREVTRLLRARGFAVETGLPRLDDTAQYPAAAREHNLSALVTGALKSRRQGRKLTQQTITFAVWDAATGSVTGRWSAAAKPARLRAVVARGFEKNLGPAMDAARPPPPPPPSVPPKASAGQTAGSAASEATLAELNKQVAENRRILLSGQTALNIVWTLLCGFLVMFMQAGFALIETGLTRPKNAAHTMGMNFLVYTLGIVGYWAVGFALQMGGIGALSTFGGDATLNRELVVTIGGKDFGLIGLQGFFLSPEVLTSPVAALFVFQMVFMATTATIPTGAMAERWKFTSFVLFSLVLSTFTYPVYGNWVWGGGWLSQLGHNFQLGHGHVDFAGSSVVHMFGGTAALVGAKMLGPRIGKYDADGNARPIPGHSIPMVVLGTFILAFGWFGFNSGSTLAGNDTRIAIIALNTMLASAAGGFGAYVYMKLRYETPDLTMMCNGLLAGLVAITAPCAFVTAPAAVFIGAVAGVLVILSTAFVEQTLKIDDPASAVSVHLTNGAWGVLALGLLADGRYGEGWNGVPGTVRGLFYGDPSQLAASVIGIVVCVVWTGTVTFLAFRLIDRVIGNRSSAREEATGLDVPEFGGPGYVGKEATPE